MNQGTLIKYSTCEFYQQFATNLEIEAANVMYYAKCNVNLPSTMEAIKSPVKF